jgi:hypothetical protein
MCNYGCMLWHKTMLGLLDICLVTRESGLLVIETGFPEAAEELFLSLRQVVLEPARYASSMTTHVLVKGARLWHANAPTDSSNSVVHVRNTT